MLTREALLAKKPSKIQKVILPDSEEFVFVRTLSSAERDQWEADNLIRERDRKRGVMMLDYRTKAAKVRLLVLAICNEQGSRILQDSDVDELDKLDSKVIAKLYAVAAALSGITDDDLDELVKN